VIVTRQVMGCWHELYVTKQTDHRLQAVMSTATRRLKAVYTAVSGRNQLNFDSGTSRVTVNCSHTQASQVRLASSVCTDARQVKKRADNLSIMSKYRYLIIPSLKTCNNACNTTQIYARR